MKLFAWQQRRCKTSRYCPLSLPFSLSVCLMNCQEIASYSNLSKASLHADPVIEMAFHADNLPCSMEVISWDLPEGLCSLINCFTIYSCRAEGCSCFRVSTSVSGLNYSEHFLFLKKRRQWNFPLDKTSWIKSSVYYWAHSATIFSDLVIYKTFCCRVPIYILTGFLCKIKSLKTDITTPTYMMF